MTVIEFCGKPGSGKTTICNNLEMLFTRDCVAVKNLHQRKRADSFMKKCQKSLHRMLYWLSPLNTELSYVLFVFAGKYRNIKNLDWIDRILEMNYLLHKNEKTGLEVALLDEGFIQLLTSICFDREINADSRLIHLINRVMDKYKYYVVKCDISNTLCAERICIRNRENDRYLANQDQSDRLLSIKETNIEMLLAKMTSAKMYRLSSGNEAEVEVFEKNIIKEACNT